MTNNTHGDDIDYVPHHMNIMAGYAIPPFRLPNTSLTSEKALEILELICAPHQGQQLSLCTSMPCRDVPNMDRVEALVDARPQGDLGRFLEAAFHPGESFDTDTVGILFDPSKTEGAIDNWNKLVVRPFIEWSRLSHESAIL
jgi:hypothetical protein